MKRVLIFFIFLLNGCDYYDHRLLVVNRSIGVIAVEYYLDTLPDFPSLNKTDFYLHKGIPLGESMGLTGVGKNAWTVAIGRSTNKKLNLVAYNIDSLQKYHSIDTLIKKRIYKRYEFFEDELNRTNWRVDLK